MNHREATGLECRERANASVYPAYSSEDDLAVTTDIFQMLCGAVRAFRSIGYDIVAHHTWPVQLTGLCVQRFRHNELTIPDRDEHWCCNTRIEAALVSMLATAVLASRYVG